LLRLRRQKVDAWRNLGVDPFGSAFANVVPAAQAIADYKDEAPVRVAGRLVSIREMGKSVFAHIQDETGKIQLYANKDALGEQFGYWKLFDLGDWVGAEGTYFTTKTGEKSVRLTSIRLLAKSLRPLPSQWHGFSDVEARYRQRYLDLIINDEARDVLVKRSRIVSEIRRFFESRGFMEVETPMMQAVAGGTIAKPFVTHHNALNIDLFMRIAIELYHKRLLVGGLTKIFEIGRNFRNEGISRKHNPEFTMLEAYWAFANFEMMADLVEDLFCTVAQNVFGTLEVGGKKEGIAPINFKRPWARKKYKDCVLEATSADWFEVSPEERRKRCKAMGIEIHDQMADYEVTNQVFEKLVEAKTRDPLFVTHLPKELIPLAKQNVEDPSVIDVFELVMGGMELVPGYTELNDPIVQRQRLEEQAGEEKQNIDEDFLLALEYGMPPAGGIGIGIDRMVMVLTGAESIRDVIYFPLLKPKS
jgi:lysyl-tRNA synthetase class 2